MYLKHFIIYFSVLKRFEVFWHVILRAASVNLKFIRKIGFFEKTKSSVSIAKPTKCTISQIYFFLTTLYIFKTVSPSSIMSLRLYVHHQLHVIEVLWLLGHRTCMTCT